MTDLICRKTMLHCQTPGMCRPHGGCRPDQGFEAGHLDLGKFVDWVWNLKAERDQLKAENEDYKSGQERYEQIIEDLKAENEALRRDAERYQWLRQGMGKVIVVEPDNAVSCDCDRYEVLLESEVDDAVDADIAKEAAHD